MKKHIISGIALALLCSSAASAQTTANRILPRVGIKGGINASSFFIEDVTDRNTMAGFNVGLFMKVPLGPHFSLMPELYYITKGSQVRYNNSFVNGDARFRLNYLEVPILLGFNPIRNLNLHAGPYVSYMLDGNVSNRSNLSLFDFERNIDADNYNRMEGGLALGAAVDFSKLSVGARYYYGMTDIGRSAQYGPVTYTFPDARNSVFNVYVALSLN
jgi:hypothetical protein